MFRDSHRRREHVHFEGFSMSSMSFFVFVCHVVTDNLFKFQIETPHMLTFYFQTMIALVRDCDCVSVTVIVFCYCFLFSVFCFLDNKGK